MQKYLIFGATGSVGSNLATQLSQANKEIHLIGRNDVELEKLSAELGCDYTVLDILSDDIYESLKNKFDDIDLAGIAYCIGSIDLKPLWKANKEDFLKCLQLNFFPIVEVIKTPVASTGTERVSKIIKKYNAKNLYILFGDELLIMPDQIKKFVKLTKNVKKFSVFNAVSNISIEDIDNNSIVKCIIKKNR